MQYETSGLREQASLTLETELQAFHIPDDKSMSTWLESSLTRALNAITKPLLSLSLSLLCKALSGRKNLTYACRKAYSLILDRSHRG